MTYPLVLMMHETDPICRTVANWDGEEAIFVGLLYRIQASQVAYTAAKG